MRLSHVGQNLVQGHKLVLTTREGWTGPVSPTITIIIYPILVPVGCSCAWAIHLCLIHPQIASEIGMLPIHPCVHDAHPHLHLHKALLLQVNR